MVLVAGDEQLPVPRGREVCSEYKIHNWLGLQGIQESLPLVSHEPRKASNFTSEQVE